MPRELTVPGGAMLSADAVTHVAVTATHRRRGLLTRMMAAAWRRRGNEATPLDPHLHRIPDIRALRYGPATWATEGGGCPPSPARPPRALPPGARLDLADGAEVRKAGPALHDRYGGRRPARSTAGGMVAGVHGGEVRQPGEPWESRSTWCTETPTAGRTACSPTPWRSFRQARRGDVTVQHLIAAAPEAERALSRCDCRSTG